MKKWQAILGTMVALVMTASVPLSSLAQNEVVAAAKPALSGSLAIVAPRSVAVAKEMSLGVFQRENQNPVPGAGVWALTREKAEEVKKTVSAQTAAADTDYEAVLGSHGSFLGRTGGDGRLVHTFRESGQYVLVAAKKGYIPDFSPLAVRGAPVDVLVIKAPRMSPPGESVTISVTGKANGEPVGGAGVWALTREQAETLKSQIARVKPTDNSSGDTEAQLNTHGIFLGRTHGNGELKYTFTEEGTYVLVTFKQGYMPGFTVINIKNIPKALVIKAPQISPVGETVTMSVTQRGTDDPAKDAGVWALTPTEAEALKARIAGTNATANTAADIDIESTLNGIGIFIGKTNGNGEVKHKFDTVGRYVLVTAKKGYIPGYTGIAIVSPKPTPKPGEKPNIAPRVTEKPVTGNNATAAKSIRTNQ